MIWKLKFATAMADLGRFPRGTQPQNMFRSAFWNGRMNGPGHRPQLPPTFEAASDMALRVVKRHYPDFTPDITKLAGSIASLCWSIN